MLTGRLSTHPAVLLQRRASPFQATNAQREDLPDYSPSSTDPAPEYNRELHERPAYTYYLRVPDKKSLIVVPYGPSSSDSYKITWRSSRLFSKKAEAEVWRTCRASAPTEDEYVAGIWFDTDGPLPWCPRARFVRRDATEGDQTYRMEARNFSDWSVSADGTLYTWILEAKPFSLVLRVDGRLDTVARFNFSVRGLTATGGAEAGDLSIYEDALSRDKAGVDVILCSLVTAIMQSKKMGRLYKNEAGAIPEREYTCEERVPIHRTSVAPFWTRRNGNGQVDF